MWRTRKNMPSFKKVSPLVYFSCWSFAILNIFFLSPTFFFTNGNAGLVLVGAVPSVLWGLVFLALGLSMITALLMNQWNIIRLLLTCGLLTKSMFAWALVFTLFASFANIGIVGVWFGLMAWQSLCIVYFTPEMKYASSI